jgi:hypothetical protein
MALTRLLMLVCAVMFVALCGGCATQGRTSQVGDIGFNPRQERELAAKKAAENYYEYDTPKAGAKILSNPAGALVEWYNDDGQWVSVGTTPTEDVVIEATGRPELFRVSAPGYMPAIRWVAVTPSSEGVTVKFDLEPELPADQYYIGR